MNRFPPSAAALLTVALACSGDGDPARPAGVGGDGDGSSATGNTVPLPSGEPFTARSAIHAVGPERTTILLSDAEDLCAALSAAGPSCGASRAASLGDRFLWLTAEGEPPGTFAGFEMTAILSAAGEALVAGHGGTLTLEDETAEGALSGTYDLAEAGVEGVAGSFTTQRCDALADDDGGSSTSCSTSLQAVNDRYQFSETCSCDGESTSRTCTRGASDTEWSCTCTAAAGGTSTCKADVEDADVVTPPEDCCER
jgi:hypothetical protein